MIVIVFRMRSNLVILLRSRKLGEPRRLGIDGDLDERLTNEITEINAKVCAVAIEYLRRFAAFAAGVVILSWPTRCMLRFGRIVIVVVARRPAIVGFVS